MTALKSLTFTTLPQVTANPTLDRRNRIVARLEEQKLLLAKFQLHSHRQNDGEEGWQEERL